MSLPYNKERTAINMPRTTAKSFPSFGTQSLQIHDRSLEVGFAFGSVGNAW